MSNERKLEIIRETAAATGGSVYPDYSGRGMFGAKCAGIACDDSHGTIEEAASRGLRGAKVDQLGRGYIVYWPGVQADAMLAQREKEGGT